MKTHENGADVAVLVTLNIAAVFSCRWFLCACVCVCVIMCTYVSQGMHALCYVYHLSLKLWSLTYLPPFHLWQPELLSGTLAEGGNAGLQMAALAWLCQ